MDSLQLEENRIQQAYSRRATADAQYSFFDQGQLFRIQQLERAILALLKYHGLASLHSRKILEVGCGDGYWLRQFVQWGASPENLTGVDLLEARIGEAIKLCPPQVQLHRANAAMLSFDSGCFDLVFQATVFTSVLDSSVKKQMAAEMVRVTKDGGLILWYDFRVNNPWNPDVRGVKSREIRSLFHGCDVELHRVTLAPPLVRRIAPYSWLVCHLLGKIPWFCSHYIGVIKPKVSASR